MHSPSQLRAASISVLAVAAILSASSPAWAELPAQAQAFIQNHCSDCHDDLMMEGDLDLLSTPFQPVDTNNFDLWVKVHDRVRDHEMPPRKKKQPTDVERTAFLEALSAPLVAADLARQGSEGRAVWRRLNRYEYELALRDLFDMPWLQVRNILPEDGEAHRFNKVGEALNISHVQMARYFQAADTAIRQAMAHQSARPETTTTRYHSRDQRSLTGKMAEGTVGRASFPVLANVAQPEVRSGKAPLTVGEDNPEARNKEAIAVISSSYEPVELHFNRFRAELPARYKLRFSAYSIWLHPESEERWFRGDRDNISEGRTLEPVTIYSEKHPRIQRKLGDFDVTQWPCERELETYLLPDETIRVDASRFFRSRPPYPWRNPHATREGQPGLAFAWMEVTGPIYDAWPTAGHKALFGDMPIRDMEGGGVEIASNDPKADSRWLMRRFMEQAYRRPVTEGQIAPMLAVVEKAAATGSSFTEAMIAGYTAVLCSPGFIYMKQEPGALDGHSIAERLAFFLWNTEPDAELRDLASCGSLGESAVLQAQTRRMLDDPRSRRFVDAFCDYWLDLRFANINDPDEFLYPDYYLDDLLVQSSVEETQRFMAELVENDLPARNIVDSDFAMLNSRLATHYGLPPVEGIAVRRVELPEDANRGGLLTQASVLKVTANGTTTSPVVRGAWMMERIVGKAPPPPPPSVPAIEPDTRGAQTIREQLELHRDDPSCNACHTRIDPVGFALENYDVFGGWRDRYRIIKDEARDKEDPGWNPGQEAPTQPAEGYGKNGQPFEFLHGPKVDATGTWLTGETFTNLEELKVIMLKDERMIARNLVNQLLVFATGAPVSFADRPQVERILDDAAPGGYGVRSLIQGIISSKAFQYK